MTCAYCGLPITADQERETTRGIPARHFHRACWRLSQNVPGMQWPTSLRNPGRAIVLGLDVLPARGAASAPAWPKTALHVERHGEWWTVWRADGQPFDGTHKQNAALAGHLVQGARKVIARGPNPAGEQLEVWAATVPSLMDQRMYHVVRDAAWEREQERRAATD